MPSNQVQLVVKNYWEYKSLFIPLGVYFDKFEIRISPDLIKLAETNSNFECQKFETF